MAKVISLRVNDIEEKLLKRAAALYGNNMSLMIKLFVFKRLTEEIDLIILADHRKSIYQSTAKVIEDSKLWENI